MDDTFMVINSKYFFLTKKENKNYVSYVNTVQKLNMVYRFLSMLIILTRLLFFYPDFVCHVTIYQQ